jgi:hypothetical protein
MTDNAAASNRPASSRSLTTLFVAVFAVSPIAFSETAPPIVSAQAPAGDEALSSVFDGIEAPGWERTGEPRVFNADNLWEYVDGDAERYVAAGMLRLRTADFRLKAGELEAVVDVYGMRDAQGARAVLQSESGSGTFSAAVGDEARSHATGLTFRVGGYFVRVEAFESMPETEAALLALGQAFARRLAR